MTFIASLQDLFRVFGMQIIEIMVEILIIFINKVHNHSAFYFCLTRLARSSRKTISPTMNSQIRPSTNAENGKQKTYRRKKMSVVLILKGLFRLRDLCSLNTAWIKEEKDLCTSFFSLFNVHSGNGMTFPLTV